MRAKEKAWFVREGANQAFFLLIVAMLKSVYRWRPYWRGRDRRNLLLLQTHCGRHRLRESELERLIDRADKVDLHSVEHVRLQVFDYVRLVFRRQDHLADSGSLCAQDLFLDAADRQHHAGERKFTSHGYPRPNRPA